MALWQLFVFCGIAILILLVIANVILPPFINKPFMFMFRKSERKLLDAEDDLADGMTNFKADQTRKGVKLLSDQTKYSRDYLEKEEARQEDRLTDNMKTEL